MRAFTLIDVQWRITNNLMNESFAAVKPAYAIRFD